MKANVIFRSLKFLYVVTVIEVLLYNFIIFNQISFLKAVSTLPESLRLSGLLDLNGWEDGWTFVYVFLLVSTCVLFFYRNPAVWIVKQVALFGLLLISLGHTSFWYVIYFPPLLILYYSSPHVAKRFGINDSKSKIKYYLISIIFFALFISLQINFNLIEVLNLDMYYIK